MAKAASAKPKAKKAKPKFADNEQSERFIETARKLGVEEAGEDFEQSMKTILGRQEPRS